MKNLCLALLTAALLGSPALATSRNYYNRIDRQIEARAASVLAESGLENVEFNARRGRIVLSGNLPSGAEFEALAAKLVAATGAISVHPQS